MVKNLIWAPIFPVSFISTSKDNLLQAIIIYNVMEN